MGIGEPFFWKKHGKLAYLPILAPKIFPDVGLRYNKIKQLIAQNNFLKRKIIGLQHRILMKKLRMAVSAKKSRRSNFDVLSQVSVEAQ